MEYVRLAEGLNDRGKLVPYEDMLNHVKDPNKDYYRSIFLYNDNHFKFFKENNTVAGIVDVFTKSIVFDFDSVDNPDQAQKDTLDLCTRLTTYGLHKDDYIISFSGNKGFSVEIETDNKFSPKQLKQLASSLATGLTTFDPKIYNASRIFRIRNTKHNKTDLYKLPISMDDLSDLTIDQIKEMAKAPTEFEPVPYIVTLPEAILALAGKDTVIEKPVIFGDDLPELDLTAKPKNMPACKYAILNGFFKPGNRSHSLMALAAHFKAQGFPKEVTYRLLKGAGELQSRRYNQEQYSKDEIWNNVISQVYGPNWQGKTYACKDHEFLQDSCPKNADGSTHCSRHKKQTIVQVNDMMDSFTNFAVDLEKNVIKTGFREVDEKLIMTTSMSVGLLGSPGSGKTSVALEILAHNKNEGSTPLFCSLDMGMPLVVAKMISNTSGYDIKRIIDIFKHDPKKRDELKELARAKYGHFPTTFKTGQGVDDIKELIIQEQDKTGKKVKLVVIDYLECLLGPYSDATANSAFFAGQLKDLSTELETCVMTLIQPQKSAGDPSSPLLSMRKVKGASTLEQNFRTILSVYREGFSPVTPEDDQFMTIACLKNTLGGLFSVDYKWNGLRGVITELSEQDRYLLDEVRNRKEDEKKEDDNGSW